MAFTVFYTVSIRFAPSLAGDGGSGPAPVSPLQSNWKGCVAVTMIHKYCQSCGMPLKRDPLRGGTNADGSKSTVYCSFCFQKGKFTTPNITIDQMKERVKGKLNDFGIPRFMAGMYTRKLHKLERWKTT